MSVNMNEFFMYTGLVVLLIILLWVVTRKLRRKFSKWDELAASFPWNGHIPESELFRHCTGSAGSVSFNRNHGELSIGFESNGIIIRANQKGWPDLCVPWNSILSAQKRLQKL